MHGLKRVATGIAELATAYTAFQPFGEMLSRDETSLPGLVGVIGSMILASDGVLRVGEGTIDSIETFSAHRNQKSN